MPAFGVRPLVGPGDQLQLTIDDRAVPHNGVFAGLEFLGPERVFSRTAAREVEVMVRAIRPTFQVLIQ